MPATTLATRPITPADKAALRRFHARLSEESRYRRFHSAKDELTQGDLRYLTEVDGERHIALVAEDPSRPGDFVGVARVVDLDNGTGEAEIAVVVRDDVQAAGVGGMLVDDLRDRASEAGMGALVAEVQADNHRALRFFQGQGARQRQTGWSGVYALILPPRGEEPSGSHPIA
ncbi:acetyltransferase [Paraconexibacter sp. AEG42_29]|uniref:Acetyltransferase n=1 Tax=Paraconexibacter sp. AEG42_29 TaxID=2997339 RepID=A0AAU7ASN6_9ACTN